MLIEFSVEEVKEIIKKFFLDEAGVKVSDVDFRVQQNRGNYYDSTTSITVSISGHINALGKEREFSKQIEKEEFKEILKNLLEQENFNIESVDFRLTADKVTGMYATCAKDLVKTNKSKR